MLKDLRHPNIVAYHSMSDIDGQFQLVMEYVVGKDAHHWVEALAGPMSASTAARIGVQLLVALDHAHSKGYVHRDIKPSNLLVSGPAPRPMDYMPIRVDGDNVLVHTGKITSRSAFDPKQVTKI